MTLIDFGFARALTPDDVVKPSETIRTENRRASYHINALDKSGHSTSSANFLDDSRRSTGSDGRRRTSIFNRQASSNQLDRSRSRLFLRQMSALGNRQYAAPEILKVKHEENSNKNPALTDTISSYVSEYGLLVDAYSLGYTIRYMLTGVPPNRRVVDVLAEKNSLPKKFGRWLNKTKNAEAYAKKRHRKYIEEDDLPGEAYHIITAMTEKEEKNRLSVRGARQLHWVSAVLPEDSNTASRGEIKYLSFATKDHPATEATTVTPQ